MMFPFIVFCTVLFGTKIAQPVAILQKESASSSSQTKPTENEIPYEATVEYKAGVNKARVHIFVQGRQFHEEPEIPKGQPRVFSVCDGSSPLVVWAYDSGRKEAGVGWVSAWYAILQSVRQIGEAETRKRYHIPLSQPLRMPSNLEDMIRPGLRIKRLDEFYIKYQKTERKRTVAGFVCDVYSHRDLSSDGSAREEEICVEPKTRFVLYQEVRSQPAKGSPAPPTRTVTATISLRLLPQIPARQFQLPPGTLVRVPLIYEGVTLPPGTKRGKPLKGGEYTNIDFGRF